MLLKIIGAVILVLVVLIAIAGFYLRSAYKNENGEWFWISYDEAVGKRMTKLGPIEDASFEILSDKRYAKDKDRVFFRGRVIEGADANTFAVLAQEGYSKDAQQVYLDRTKVILADPETFEVLSFPYAKDGARAYCGTLPLNLAAEEVAEFKVRKKIFSASSMKIEILLSSFISQNPEYGWLDTLEVKNVIVGEGRQAETKDKLFDGYRESEK